VLAQYIARSEAGTRGTLDVTGVQPVNDDHTEQISTQQRLLSAHRRTLASYLEQCAIHGIAFVPPAVQYGIREARDNIQRIKKILNDWGVHVSDDPNDYESSSKVATMSENLQILISRGDAYAEGGNRETALDCYRAALEQTDDKSILVTLLHKIATIHYALHHYQEAVQAYKEVLRYTEPQKVADIFVMIGRVHQRSGNHREAVQSYRKAIEQSIGPTFEGDVLYWLGETIHKVPEWDRDDESLRRLDEAKLKPRKTVLIWEIYNTKGHVLNHKKRFQEALQEFDKALAESVDVIDIPGNLYNNKASCLEEMRDFQTAISLYRETLDHYRSRFDTKGFAAYRIGVIQRKTDLKSATASLQNARNYFEQAKSSGQVPPWHADSFLSAIEKELVEVQQELKPTRVITILFLASDPSDQSRLRLGEELREIQEKIQLSKLRDKFNLQQRTSVRPMDISQALLDVQPQILHFSGHGTTTGALCFENQIGETHPVQPDALAALFEQFAHQVNCVLLNACYSEIQAKAIAEYIKYVIGMNQAIGDKAAIAFAIGFYQALGAGRTIEDAYKLGCVQIRLQGIPEHLTPVLIKKE